jgi:hypothetical protein
MLENMGYKYKQNFCLYTLTQTMAPYIDAGYYRSVNVARRQRSQRICAKPQVSYEESPIIRPDVDAETMDKYALKIVDPPRSALKSILHSLPVADPQLCKLSARRLMDRRRPKRGSAIVTTEFKRRAMSALLTRCFPDDRDRFACPFLPIVLMQNIGQGMMDASVRAKHNFGDDSNNVYRWVEAAAGPGRTSDQYINWLIKQIMRRVYRSRHRDFNQVSALTYTALDNSSTENIPRLLSIILGYVNTQLSRRYQSKWAMSLCAGVMHYIVRNFDRIFYVSRLGELPYASSNICAWTWFGLGEGQTARYPHLSHLNTLIYKLILGRIVETTQPQFPNEPASLFELSRRAVKRVVTVDELSRGSHDSATKQMIQSIPGLARCVDLAPSTLSAHEQEYMEQRNHLLPWCDPMKEPYRNPNYTRTPEPCKRLVELMAPICNKIAIRHF